MRSLFKHQIVKILGEKKLHTLVQTKKKNKTSKKDIVPTGLDLIKAKYGWIDSEGEGVVVAVLDTGADMSHTDLAPNMIGGKNFVAGYPDDDIRDFHGHGTHVAGIIAAAKNNQGIIGVAPKAKLLIGRVLSPEGYGEDHWIANAIRWAIRWRGPSGEKVNIINMSLGGPEYSAEIHRAVKAAVKHNISVICAAGNEGDGKDMTNEVSYPAYFPEVIAVGAIDEQQRAARFSNTNREIDVAAPGYQILSTLPEGKYGVLSGTSMAAPHVSGFASIVIGKYMRRLGTTPTDQELYALIKFLTKDVEGMGIDASTGAGLISFLPK